MREFNNQIDIAVIYEVDTAIGQTVSLKADASWLRCDANSEVKPTDKPKNKSAGNLYQQNLKVSIQKLTDTEKAKLSLNIKAIVKLHDADGELIWGDMNIPCRINLTPGIQSDTLQITRSALAPLL